jgi:hypothetical protein
MYNRRKGVLDKVFLTTIVLESTNHSECKYRRLNTHIAYWFIKQTNMFALQSG